MIFPLKIVIVLSAMVVIASTLQAVAGPGFKDFSGHPVRFACLALYWSAVGAGAVAILFGIAGAFPIEWGTGALLFGLAMRTLADRRRG